MSQNQVTTYIGVAFCTKEGFPAQLAVVLSKNMQFNVIESSGTIIESVNGWGEQWKHCVGGASPTFFEPLLNLVGILMIGVANMPPDYISESIVNQRLAVREARVNPDSLKHPYSNDYVCQAILHLCEKRTISLPPNIQTFLDGYITDGLVKLRRNQESRPDLYSVISLLGDRAPVFGRLVQQHVR